MLASELQDHFESCKFAIRVARSNISEFKNILAATFGQGRGQLVTTIGQQTGNKTYKLVFGGPIPDRARDIAQDGIIKLRHALDIATVAAFEIVTSNPADNYLYFPVGDSLVNFRSRVDNIIPTELRQLFHAFSVYPPGDGNTGGNRLIYDLCMAAKLKHRITCRVGPIATSQSLTNLDIADPIDFPEIAEWDISKNEMVFCTTGPNGHFVCEFNVVIQINYHDAGPLTGENVETTITKLVNEVERIVCAIEAECAKIVNSSGNSGDIV